MNPLFTVMNGQPNMMQAVQQLKQNPMQMLLQKRLNVPGNLMNNPSAILQHLLSTGQVSQSQINAAYNAAQRLGLK